MLNRYFMLGFFVYSHFFLLKNVTESFFYISVFSYENAPLFHDFIAVIVVYIFTPFFCFSHLFGWKYSVH